MTKIFISIVFFLLVFLTITIPVRADTSVLPPSRITLRGVSDGKDIGWTRFCDVVVNPDETLSLTNCGGVNAWDYTGSPWQPGNYHVSSNSNAFDLNGTHMFVNNWLINDGHTFWTRYENVRYGTSNIVPSPPPYPPAQDVPIDYYNYSSLFKDNTSIVNFNFGPILTFSSYMYTVNGKLKIDRIFQSRDMHSSWGVACDFDTSRIESVALPVKNCGNPRFADLATLGLGNQFQDGFYFTYNVNGKTKMYQSLLSGDKITTWYRYCDVTPVDDNNIAIQFNSCSPFTQGGLIDIGAIGQGPQSFINAYVHNKPLKTCSVTVGTNDPVTINFSGTDRTGDADTVQLWMISSNDGKNKINPPPGPEDCYSSPTGGDCSSGGGFWYYKIGQCSTSSSTTICSGSSPLTNLPIGTFSAYCDLETGIDKCSGNPTCSYYGGSYDCSGWNRCHPRGTVDHFLFTVLPSPTPTPIPIPPTNTPIPPTATPIPPTDTPIPPTPTPTPIPGDITGPSGVPDRKVDIYDYNKLIGDFGRAGSPGFIPSDIEKNGKIDIYDYNTLIGNFGRMQ